MDSAEGPPPQPPLMKSDGSTYPWRIEEDDVLLELGQELQAVPVVRADPPLQPHRPDVVPEEAVPTVG